MHRLMADHDEVTNIANVKKLTCDQIVHEKLLLFEPKPEKHETLSDLFRNITKEQQLKKLGKQPEDSEIPRDKVNTVPEFKTARQALEEKRGKVIKNQPRISNFFKNSISIEANESENTFDEESEETESMANKTSGRKDLKSLFGDDDSEEENLFSTKNSRLDGSDNGESMSSSKEKHKSRHSRNAKHSDKHRDREEEKKRRKSTDREDDKKRIKDENSPRRYSTDNFDIQASADEKYNELFNRETVEDEGNLIDLDTSCSNEDTFYKENKSEMRSNDPMMLPEIKPYKPNGEGSKKQRLKKTEVGGLVVKLLTPAYADRRFESRELFKSLARSISHSLADKDEKEIKDYVHKFLEKNEAITSHTKL